MNLTETPAEIAFRSKAAQWFRSVLPEVWQGSHRPSRITEDQDYAMRRRYDRAMYRDGWAGLTWRREYGGVGASPTENMIFAEEAVDAGAPEVFNRSGLGVAGPTIATCGTNEQKARYLPKILSSDEIWCQGFSEPNAGSDLASISTRATKIKGGWDINGQKIWTTLGQFADFCYVLARTGIGAKKQDGLTAFIVPMRQAGVHVRSIRQINGEREFNEVFFDGAFATADQVIGEVGAGWRVAMETLGLERSTHFVARQLRLGSEIKQLATLVRERRDDVPDGLKDRLVEISARGEALRWTMWSHVARFEAGGQAGVLDIASKVYWSEVWQELAKLALDIEAALGESIHLTGRREPDWTYTYLNSRASTIYAGTSEIQKSIIGERGLGLPKA